MGQTLCGRYQITHEIGTGGFGAVYLAKDEKLVSKPVVVKVLNHLAADNWAVRKFHQEMEALARIDHPGVVAVLDQGQTPDGEPLLVMQFIDGITLRKMIAPGGMDLRRAATIIRQIGSALGAAHEKGVFHRDLKPENIMVQAVDAEPHVKLIDFGIAGIKDSLYSQEEQSTRIAGTYRYMPPEQLEGKVCLQSDVYAFGAIAFEMLTGQPGVKSPMELIAMKNEGLKVKPRDLRPEIPPAAQNVILKALSFEAGDRFASAREMGDLLADALLGAGSTVRLTEATRATLPPADRLEIAHVLFLDLVGFSTQAMEHQRTLLDTLQSLVRATPHFVEAEQARELIALPTGDGMALVFLGNPVAAAECALEVGRAARHNSTIQLRTGLHSGPVYRVADINKNLNVTGGGINMAQRVMDAGDAGHILVSGAIAETLVQLAGWKGRLSDLGEHPVKHGAMMRFYNLCTEDAGNAKVPSKWVKASVPPPKSRRGLVVGAVAVTVLAAVGIYLGTRPANKPVVAPPALEARLEYSISLIPVGDAEPIHHASEGTSYRKKDQIAIEIKTVQAGYLYLLDDGPLPDKARTPSISVLRPGADDSAAAAAGQTVRTPEDPSQYLHLDGAKGNEDVYLVWSAKPVDDLEKIKGLKELRMNGEVIVRDPAQLASLRDFLSKRADATKKEVTDTKSVLSTKEEILVGRIRLAHD